MSESAVTLAVLLAMFCQGDKSTVTHVPLPVPPAQSTTPAPRPWLICKLDAITTLRGEVFAFQGKVSQPMPSSLLSMQHQWRWNEFESVCQIMFWWCPSTFLTTNTVSRLVSAFLVVSTVWPVSCLLFFYSWTLWCPRAQPFVKVGARPPCPM